MFLSSSKTITVAVDGAASAAESHVTAHYVDYAATATTPDESDCVTTGATPVTAVAAPAAGVVRHLHFFSIFNADTIAHSYTVSVLTGSTPRKVVVMTLQPSQSVQYTKADGWKYVPTSNPQHQEVSKSITAADMWSDPLLVQAGDAVSISVSGTTWAASVSVQRMLDGVNWNTVTLPDGSTGVTAAVELTYLADETGYLRIGVPAGMFSSGSIPVRLGVH